MTDNADTLGVAANDEAPAATPVDLGAIAEDSKGYLITAAQLLAGTTPGNQGLFEPSSVPDIVTADDSYPVELGVQFRASVDGSIAGIQFYKGPDNIGPHVANLWTADGTLIASATFTDETASGWQQVNFATPVEIVAGTTYVASYHTSGHYSADLNYFNDPLIDGQLSAPGRAGVYAYGDGTLFPDQSFSAANYWVDVVFNAPVTITALTLNSGNGTLLDNNDGTWTYTPAADDDSAASFSYSASDGSLSAVSTATLDINPVNDASVLAGTLSATVLEGGDHIIAAGELGFTDPDDVASGVTFLVSGIPVNGEVRIGGFAVTSFTGQQLADGLVSFHHDGGETATASFQVTLEDGNEDGSALPLAQSFNVTVAPVNDAPVMDLNGAVTGTGAILNYAENDAPTAVAPAAIVNDIDSVDFNGGSLTVHFAANGAAEDQLTILRTGGVTLAGSNVLVGGHVIGTFSGGADGADLVVTFTSGFASPGAISSLIEHIGYSNNTDTPSTLPRTLTFTVDDGDGGTSNSAMVAVNVAAVNDPATVTLSNIHAPIAENNSTAVHIKAADIVVTDPDGGSNNLSLSGIDANLFEIVGRTLWLKAGALLNFETNPILNVTVNVNDTMVGGPIDASASLAIKIVDVVETINGTAAANTLSGANNARDDVRPCRQRPHCRQRWQRPHHRRARRRCAHRRGRRRRVRVLLDEQLGA